MKATIHKNDKRVSSWSDLPMALNVAELWFDKAGPGDVIEVHAYTASGWRVVQSLKKGEK